MTTTDTAPDVASTATADVRTYTYNAADYLRAVRVASLVASKDAARPLLTAAIVEHDGEGFTVTATDSYRLATTATPWGEENGEENGNGSYLLPGELIATACKTWGTSAVNRWMRTYVTAPATITATITATDVTLTADGATLTARAIDGTFPDWQQLIPSGDDAETFCGPASFDPAKLATVGKVAAAFGPSRDVVTFHRIDASKPLVASMKDGERVCRFLLMPVRVPA
jgi:DNA polymerase III beta subunit, central domain